MVIQNRVTAKCLDVLQGMVHLLQSEQNSVIHVQADLHPMRCKLYKSMPIPMVPQIYMHADDQAGSVAL